MVGCPRFTGFVVLLLRLPACVKLGKYLRGETTMKTFSKSCVGALLLIATAVPSSWAHHLPIRGYSQLGCMGIAKEYPTPEAAKKVGMKSYANIDEGGGCINFCP